MIIIFILICRQDLVYSGVGAFYEIYTSAGGFVSDRQT